ncbi:MATE family efflux transporter [Aquirhabdus sp.]|uniref:MATE family efflux transporter n=1 Tax=Aquirhabdus sp. TaxID=2824160 RepID=UPI00396C9299
MLPILLTQVAQAGFGLIDTIMAGRVSAGDLASVALGVGFWLPIFLLIGGILQATTPLVAQAFGARIFDSNSLHKIPQITRQSLWLALLLGLVGLLLLQLAPLMFQFLEVPLILQAKTRLFIMGVSLGLPAVAFYTALRCYTEALGKPRPVTVISLCGLALAVPLNYLFIYGFHIGSLTVPALGGAGCGFATAILQWLMLITLVTYLSLAKHYRAFRVFEHFEGPDKALILRIVRLGFPIGIAIFFEVTLFSLAALVVSPFGETVIAAHQVALSATSQLFMIPLSLAIAVTIRMGQLYGQRDVSGMRRLRKVGLTLGTGLAIFTMILIAIFRHDIAVLYSNDLKVQALAATLLLFAMAYQLVDSWQVTTAACLRGMQDTKVTMWITFFAYWVVAFPTGIFLSRGLKMGAQGFWFGLLIGLAVAAVLLLLRLRKREKRVAIKFSQI